MILKNHFETTPFFVDKFLGLHDRFREKNMEKYGKLSAIGKRTS